MCGINGIYLRNPDRPVDQTEVVRLRDLMIHRGPDDSGVYVDRDLALGHRRLSIIDLSSGHQPMATPDQRYWIVYNGETYNYRALRRELEGRGCRFQTESDTEVVLNLYVEYGENCVSRMNGLFAFAIWDTHTRRLFIARDRLGIKPLYYADSDNGFVFGSEAKAVLASSYCRPAINQDAVYEYFLFRAVTGEQTLFSGIRSVPPGHYMTVSEKTSSIVKYWDGSPDPHSVVRSEEEAEERLEDLLVDAVKIRLMSDVPLGTFCSGGVDSSLVTAISAQASSSSINTFSVGFNETDYDESEYARAVSAKYGTSHHEIQLDGREYAKLLPDLVKLNDEPLNFANSIHIYAVSKLAKNHVTVVLTGEGADELFLGYPRYHVSRIASSARSVKWLANPLLAAAAALLRDHRYNKLRHYLSVSREDLVLLNAATASVAQVESVLDDQLASALDYRRQILSSFDDEMDMMTKLSVNDQKTYLVSILNRQDKMSMAASIEARVPFLDYRIVEFANGLRWRYKTSRSNTKEIVKRIALRYLPDEIVNRRKSGFGVPIAQYFRDENGLGGLAANVIHETEYEGFLNKNVLIKLLEEHRTGLADHSELLWTTVNFLTWKMQYEL